MSDHETLGRRRPVVVLGWGLLAWSAPAKYNARPSG